MLLFLQGLLTKMKVRQNSNIPTDKVIVRKIAALQLKYEAKPKNKIIVM